jgi:hypothetical protein
MTVVGSVIDSAADAGLRFRSAADLLPLRLLAGFVWISGISANINH